MVYSLLYRRPAHVSNSRRTSDSTTGHSTAKNSVDSGHSNSSAGIPEALSFDRIIDGGTCPPCTTREFMNYLRYIEFSAENLQFFLWYRSYEKRWAQLSDGERTLSPEWTKADAAQSIPPRNAAVALTQLQKFAHSDDEKTMAKVPVKDSTDPFDTPPKSPSHMEKSWSDSGSTSEAATAVAHTHEAADKAAENAFEGAGISLMPFTTQPYRSEISRIITAYIAPGGSRELNLSGRERQAVLHALQKTTHPSAFREIVASVEFTLRKQAHPNFVRWTICNGNRPRVIFARGLGIFTIAVGLIASLLITLSHASRPWRVLPLIAWFIGIATLIAAWKGMCVVLHGLHRRHLRPWELFGDDDASDDADSSWRSSISTSSNSFEDEPWVPRYEKRNIIRKVFDREVWIQEPALRQIQDTIFLQALLGSFALSALIVGIFCAVPAGMLF